jgi:hypothetical protein
MWGMTHGPEAALRRCNTGWKAWRAGWARRRTCHLSSCRSAKKDCSQVRVGGRTAASSGSARVLDPPAGAPLPAASCGMRWRGGAPTPMLRALASMTHAETQAMAAAAGALASLAQAAAARAATAQAPA